MYQYYIIEIQQYANGEYGHIVHFAYDEDISKARMKAESKYHEVLAAAAISELPSHAASLIASDGGCIMNQCYQHPLPEPEPVVEPEVDPEPVDDGTGEDTGEGTEDNTGEDTGETTDPEAGTDEGTGE